MDSPDSVAVDASGNVYVASYWGGIVRRIDAAGVITTFAGTGEEGFSGDGGPAAQARLDRPAAVAVDASGNVYIADLGNQRVRRIDTAGMITTFAGTGEEGLQRRRRPGGPGPVELPHGSGGGRVGQRVRHRQ